MRSVPLLALALAGAGSASRVAHRDFHHRHQHAHKQREAALAQRDFQVTEVSTIVSTVFETLWVDGSTAASSKTTSSAAAVFFEKPSSIKAITTSTSVAIPKQELKVTTTTPPPAPKPTTTAGGIGLSLSLGASVGVGGGGGGGGGSPAKEGEFVVTVVNRHTAAVVTGHDDTSGSATSDGKVLGTGTMQPGATATFAVGAGWIGNIKLGVAGQPLSNDASLFEGNMRVWNGESVPRFDHDFSLVMGYTLSGTVHCAGVTKGCRHNLFSLMDCPSGVTDGACANPLRNDGSASQAAPFFAQCQNDAWTFVEDGKADSNCLANGSNSATWCIGTADQGC